MNTLILNAETAKLSLGHLLNQVSSGGVEVQDALCNIVAFVLSPTDQEALTYAEANLDLNRHLAQVRQALARRGGITRSPLLAKAATAAEKAGQQ
jgi:hypothetical protein